MPGRIEALQKAAGRYQVIYSESTAMRTDNDGMRHHAWAVAMGGLMPMLLRHGHRRRRRSRP